MKNYCLNNHWKLYPKNKTQISKFTNFFEQNSFVEMDFPSDIHSILIDNNIIEDPYLSDNEKKIQWVGKLDWVFEKTIILDQELSFLNAFLKLSNVDTIATLTINNIKVMDFENQFITHTINIKEYLIKGENTFNFTFFSSEEEAIKRANENAYPIPYSIYPISSKNRNFIRKTQAHSGWDWGPCIMAIGIYDDLNIDFSDEGYISYTKVNTVLKNKNWIANIEIAYNSETEETLPLEIKLNNKNIKENISIKKGENIFSKQIVCNDIEPWWPNNEGEQNLYPLEIKVGNEKYLKQIGFREIIVKKDNNSLVFCINNRDIFIKGTNWIPQDSLPKRYTDQRYESLIEACKTANMNMIRVWGGGLYEKDIFYELCDQKGILIWQDCMFACSLYPSTNQFLDSVEKEITCQVRRLQYHPSLALWCGNNEDLGAINGYDEARNIRDRYIVDYDRLNEGVVAKVIKKEDPSRAWWPSSPCAGENDYSDNWHDDSKGDMHFWSVWHEGKDFEEYYKIKPRFVSEFGYQSLPYLSTIKTFCSEDDLNLTSEIMEHHQKNIKGNTIILENFTRYYLFPSSFEKQIYLSQIQQAKAMKIAIEYFRSLKTHCMGSLYWQLNDCWPVSSWSSIDYFGKWKALHYEAKRFYSPLLLALINKEDITEIHFINDSQKELSGMLIVEIVDFDGNVVNINKIPKTVKANTALLLEKMDTSQFETSEVFIKAKFVLENDEIKAYTLLTKEKLAHIKKPDFKINITEEIDFFKVELKVDKPTFNVLLDTPYNENFSDNNLFIDKEVILKFPKSNIDLQEFIQNLKIYDLYSLK